MKPFTPVAIFFIAFGVFLYTLHPTVAPYRDSGDLVVASHTLGIAHPPGYPLYVLSGKVADMVVPAGNSAYRINVLSAFCGAGALLLLALVVSAVAANASAAVPFTVLVLAFSPAYWRLSQVSEMYSYNALLAALLILVAVLLYFNRSKEGGECNAPLLYFLGFACGLSIGNHQTVVLLFPGFLALFPRRDGWRVKHFAGAVLFFALGLSVYLFLPVRSATHPLSNWGDPESFSRLLRLMTRSDYGGARLHPEQSTFVWSVPTVLAHLGVYARSLVQQFTWPAVIAGALGIWYARKDRFFVFLAAGLVIAGPFFVILSNLPPQEKTTLPILEPHLILPSVFFMIFVAIGAARIAAWRFGAVIVPALILIAFLSHLPLCDYRQHYFAYDYGRNILATIGPGGIIYDPDDSTAFTTSYLQVVEKKRPDVRLAAFFRTRWGYEQMKKNHPDMLPDREISSGRELATVLLDHNRARSPVYADLPSKFPGGYVSYPDGILSRLSSAGEYRPSGTMFELYARHGLEEQETQYDFFTDHIISYYSAAHNNLGLALAAGRDDGAAEREYVHALAIEPGLAAAYNNLGTLRYGQGRYEEAEKYFTRVIALNPERSSPYYNLGLVYKAGKKAGPAKEMFYRAWETDRNPDAGNELGLMALNSGDARAAAVIFQEIVGRYPSYLTAYYNLGLSLSKSGDYSGSRKAFEFYMMHVQDPGEKMEVQSILKRMPS